MGTMMPTTPTAVVLTTLASSSSECPTRQEEKKPGYQKPPHECTLPLSEYQNSAVVKQQCSQKETWGKLAQKAYGHGDCTIDQITKKMHCHRDETCNGGKRVTENFTKGHRKLEYNCGASREGPLLIDCCQTCDNLVANPASVEVDSVICQGCDKARLQKI